MVSEARLNILRRKICKAWEFRNSKYNVPPLCQVVRYFAWIDTWDNTCNFFGYSLPSFYTSENQVRTSTRNSMIKISIWTYLFSFWIVVFAVELFLVLDFCPQSSRLRLQHGCLCFSTWSYGSMLVVRVVQFE